MKKSRLVSLLVPLAVLSALSGTGCNQASAPSSASAPDSESKAPPRSDPDPESIPYDKLEFTDITEAEAKIPKPLMALGEGPVRQADPDILVSLRDSFLKRGQSRLAKRLERSYDIQSGLYRGSPETVSALGKSAAWSTGEIKHRVAVVGKWLPYVGNSQWSGASDGVGADPSRLFGWNIATNVVNGVTPSLKFSVVWSDAREHWTTYKTWNQDHSASLQTLQKIKAYTTYGGWSVCYKVNTGIGTSSNCNDQPAGSDVSRLYGIWFNMYQY